MRPLYIPSCRGQMHTSGITGFSVTTDYAKVTGTWHDGSIYGFTVDDVNDRLRLTGSTGCYLFNGTSYVKTDKACTLTYGLYKNGVLVTDSQGHGLETPVDIASSSKFETLSICTLIPLNSGDYMEVWVKADQSVSLDINSLNIVFTQQQ